MNGLQLPNFGLMNRRMRNRTYGGVRGLRGQPLTLLDVDDNFFYG